MNRFALALGLLLFLAPHARAQDEALDADPRAFDRVWLTGNDDPIECEIQESPDPGKLVYKKKGNTITVDRTQVARIVTRQTPLDALKERGERIKAGTPEEHRKLGDWAWRQGLEPEALVELRKSVQAATDPQASIPFRARLARLLVARANHLDGDAREDVWDELFKLGKKCEKLNALSPEVQLGLARALLAQGIAPPAVPYLEKARETLAQAASGPPVAEDPKVTPLVKEDPKPVVKDPPKKDDPPDRGVRNPRRGDRNGADPNQNPPKAPPVKQEAIPLEDHAQEKWPGIPADRRLVYRDVLLSLAEAYVKTDRPTDAATALGPVIDCWPQDKAGLALRAQAKVLAGDPRGAVTDLAPAIAAYPDDPALLRDRGISSYAAGDLDAARVDLEKSLALGIDDPRPVQAHLGLVHLRAGRFAEAKTAFDAANSGGPYGLAKLGLGLLAELQGHPEDALTLYEEARPLLEQDGLLSYSLALARIKANKLDDAQQAARVALKEGLPFPSGARTLAAVARAKGDAKMEVRILEELVGSGVRTSADDLYALGRAYATADRLGDARLVFDRAVALVATHVPALLGAGYVRYAADDREAARDLFQRALVAANPDPAAKDQPPEVVFAKRALKNLEDARTRRVWIDRFDQDDGDAKNGWTVHAGYGVDVSVKGKKLVFDGTQKSEVDGGKTRVSRELPGQTIVKVEARLDLSHARDARAGIRFETEKGNAIVYRDKDELFMATANQGPQITEDRVKIGAWPKDDRPHVLAIEIEDVGASLVSFWLDGDRLGNPIKIGTMGRATKPVLSVYAAAPAGTAFVAVAEEVRVYAQRPQPSGKSGGN